MSAFDETSQYRLSVSDAPNYSPISRFLARTIYIPRVDLKCEWTFWGHYEKATIVELIGAGLKDDDDIIQQWFDADNVLRLLKGATSFDELVVAVQCVGGQHEDDEDSLQYVLRMIPGWSEDV